MRPSSPDRSPARSPPIGRLLEETNLLYRDVISFSASARVVNLRTKDNKLAGQNKTWSRMQDKPSHQLLERKLEAEQLKSRVRGLLERAGGVPTRIS